MNLKNKKRTMTIIVILLCILTVFIGLLFKDGILKTLKTFIDNGFATVYHQENADVSNNHFHTEGSFTEINLGSDIKLTNLFQVTGNFPEDGSDEFCENLLAAAFRNDSDRAIQYMTVNVTINKEIYAFSFSTIPVGESVIAYEMNKKKAPEEIANVSAEAEHIAFFQTEPSLFEEQLEFSVDDQTITVKNVSSQIIDKEISIYYKNYTGGSYMGGITYRLRIGESLEPGESCSGYASHVSKTQTKVMFVTYGN